MQETILQDMMNQTQSRTKEKKQKKEKIYSNAIPKKKSNLL
jgi:hypothetical protein